MWQGWEYNLRRYCLGYAALIIRLVVERWARRREQRKRMGMNKIRRQDKRRVHCGSSDHSGSRRSLIFLRFFRFPRVSGIFLQVRWPSPFPDSGLRLLTTTSSTIHNIPTHVLSEASTLEARQILIPYRPQRPPHRAFPRDLAETHSSAEDVPNAVHPRRLTTFEVRKDNGDPIIDLLKGKTVFRRGNNSSTNEGGIGEVGFVGRIGPWGKVVRESVVFFLKGEGSHGAWGGDHVNHSARRRGEGRGSWRWR